MLTGALGPRNGQLIVDGTSESRGSTCASTGNQLKYLLALVGAKWRPWLQLNWSLATAELWIS